MSLVVEEGKESHCRKRLHIPENATIRKEFVKGSGPYLYAYWKENKRLRKKYIGKSWKDAPSILRKSPAQLAKFNFISSQAIKEGNKLAREYYNKISYKQVSIDWAYKVVVKNVLDCRLRKLADIMDTNGRSKGEPIESDNNDKRLAAASLTANIMDRIGLDYTNEQDINRFLDCKPGDPIFESLKLPKFKA